MKTNYILKKRSFIFLFFIALSFNLYSQAIKQCVTPLQNGDKVLFIGNSFTEWNGPLPEVIQSLIKASGSGLNVSFTYKVKGMGIFKEFATWNSLGMIAEIQKGGWKYVVLQGWGDAIGLKDGGVTEDGVINTDYLGYPECQDTMLKYLRVLDAEIKKVGAVTILYEPHVDKPAFGSNMAKSHDTYAKLQYHVSSFYAPIINAWDIIRQRYPTTDSSCYNNTPGSYADFMYADCGHQSVNGMMLDALTFYTIFTQRSGFTLKPITVMSRPDLYNELAQVGYNTGKSILAANGCGFTDTEAPTTPTNLATTNLLSDSYNLTWTASTDNIGVLGYHVYMNNVLLNTTSIPKLAVGGLTPSTSYAMKVIAFDSEGNQSSYSSVLNVTTPASASVDTSGILLSWNLTGAGNDATVAANQYMTGISASNPSGVLKAGAGLIPGSFGSNAYSIFSVSSTTLANAIAENKYISFSISPQAGNSISLASLQVRPYTQNHPLNYTIMSSVKGFNAGNEIQTITETSQANTSLQTININDHDNITTTTELRIYIWGYNDTWSAAGLGNGDAGTTTADLLLSGSVKSDALPSFPTGLTATNLTESGFTLNWKAAKNAVLYEVFKDGVSVGTSASLSMAINSVTINSIYNMTVKATDNLGTISEASNVLEVKIPDLHNPTVPTNLSVTGITENSFILHWDEATDNVAVTLYEIFMDGKAYGNTADNYLPVPFLLANTSYSMTVRAKDAAGNVSDVSNNLIATTITTSLQVSEEVLNIYPNPVIHILNIAGIEVGSVISIYDLQGNLQLQKIAENNLIQIDVNSISTGVYIIKIRNSRNVVIDKFVKEY